MTIKRVCLLATLLTLTAACGPTRPPDISENHLSKNDVPPAIETIPAPVNNTTLLPRPISRPALETYTVVVNDVPVKELLFSMARDAKINIDIAPDVSGTVTLNAIDQTLPQILDRITRQTDVRYELVDDTLRVAADSPFLRTYRIDYLNMSRDSKGLVSVSTSVGTTGGAATAGGSASSGNDSNTQMNMASKNHLWSTLTRNISAIIGDKIENAATEDLMSTANVIVNRESGILAVNTSQKKHQQVQGFIDEVMNSAKRQVLIEVTIAEVTLSDSYQSGVDWSVLANDPTSGISFSTNLVGADLDQSPFSLLEITDTF